MDNSKRLVVCHGVFLFLLGLLTGLVREHFTNVRMSLAAHLEGGHEWNPSDRPGRYMAGSSFVSYFHQGNVLVATVRSLLQLACHYYYGHSWYQFHDADRRSWQISVSME